MPDFKYLNEVKTQELINEIKTRLSTKIAHYTSMPLASADYSGQVVQYIGTTNASYVNGDFYRCDYDELANPQAVWTKITYAKAEIDNLINTASHFEAVETLPTTNIKTNVIYLVPKTKQLAGYEDNTNNLFYVATGTTLELAYDKYGDDGYFIEEVTLSDAEDVADAISEGTYTSATHTVKARDLNNVKTEYINLNGTTAGWEKIGETNIDLSDYVKFENLIPITTAELEAMWSGT